MIGAKTFCWLNCRHLARASIFTLAIICPTTIYAQSFGAALTAYLDGETEAARLQMHELADAGNLDALLFLAEDAQRQFGLSETGERATALYARAAAQGSNHAQRRLGDIYKQRAEDASSAEDRHALFQVARHWYQQASAQGNAHAALAFARLLSNGLGGAADPEEALTLYTLAAEADQPGADRELGLLLMQQNRFDDAVVWLFAAAEGGDPDAQAVLSELYLLGIAVEQSDSSSLHWLEQSAAGGNISAQRDLAARYWSGIGVPQDRDRAYSLLQAAADGGNVMAQNDLGWMHYRGLGMPLDYGLARQYFTAAAELGSAEGQYRLAQMVKLSQGGDSLGPIEDNRQATDLLLSSAQQGYLPAQMALARQYEAGIGMFRDDEQALFWYRAAAEQGDTDAEGAVSRMLAQGRGVPRFEDGPVSHFGHLPEVLFVTGPFNAGDGERITSAINRIQPSVIVLHSRGGIVAEAMEVADIIHDRGIITYVPSRAECLSACVYVFSAGRERFAEGQIGVHQLQAAEGNAVVPMADFQAIISQILRAMNQYDVPPFLIERILGSSDMYILTNSERNQITRGHDGLSDSINIEMIESVLEYQFSESRPENMPMITNNAAPTLDIAPQQ